MKHRNIASIILAAGNSSRLGQAKQLVRRGNQSMIQYIYEQCVSANLGPTYILTGAYHEEISKELPKASILHYSDWEDGMGSTISFAMNQIQLNSLDGVVIVLSDQIFLTSSILLNLVQEAYSSKSSIVNCEYQNGMGPPTYFDKSLFRDLTFLEGADGAKSIVSKHMNHRSFIQFPKGYIDIDTQEDLNLLMDL